MKTQTISPDDASIQILVIEAANDTVTLVQGSKPVAVVLSPSEYQRLDAQDQMKQQAKKRLRQIMAVAHEQAAARGLTEDELERLLADEG